MNPEIMKERYAIVNQIGKGGMSEVLLCEDRLLHTFWAGKRIWKTEEESSKIAYQALKKETKMLVTMKHKSIPAIIDCIDKEDSYTVIMDFINGKSLYQMRMQEHVSEIEIIKWAEAILHIFHYLHHEVSPPIVFRDLKPENLLLKDDGELMLIDFGIAFYLEGDGVNNTPCMGTRGYASLEQSTPGHIDCRSDIYSFGATLFFLCTKTIYQKQKIPNGVLHNIMEKCLQEEVENRYQSVDDILHDVRRCKKLKSYLRTPFCFSLLCLLLSVYAQFQYQKGVQQKYQEYLQQQAYEEAIQLIPSKKDAYLYYYSECKKGSIPEAIQQMENLAIGRIDADERDELLFEMAFDCFTLDKPEFYRQAAMYLRQIVNKDVEVYIRLCDMFSSSDDVDLGKLEEFINDLKALEEMANNTQYPKLQLQFYDILIRLYTLKQDSLGYIAYEGVLRIAQKGASLVIDQETNSLLQEYQLYFCEKEVLAYGNLGNYLDSQGQKESARLQFGKMIEQYQEYQNKGILTSPYIEEKITQVSKQI